MTEFKSLPTGRQSIVDKPRDSTEDGKAAGVVGHGLAVTDSKHYLIHLSDLYNISYRFEDTANDETEKFLIRVTAGKILAVDLEFDFGGAWDIDIYENPTVTAQGTEVIGYNVNRRDTSTINSRFFYTPTATSGTLIECLQQELKLFLQDLNIQHIGI